MSCLFSVFKQSLITLVSVFYSQIRMFLIIVFIAILKQMCLKLLIPGT